MKLQYGMIIQISDRNTNHLGYGVCAYAGMKGKVKNVFDDGGFVLDTGSSTLVVPMVIFGKRKTKHLLVEDIAGNWVRWAYKPKQNGSNFVPTVQETWAA